jgi:7-cyano-7-deazaguanine synthase
MIQKAHALVLVSGGIDSYACAHFLLKHGFAVSGLFVEYGQEAQDCERASARGVCTDLKIPLRVIRVIFDETFGAGEVLGRNLFLVATALLASKEPICGIAIGLHAGTPYYDCSDGFFDRVDTLLSEHTDGRTTFLAPFRSWTKQQVYSYAVSEQLLLDITYSCERPGPSPCGECLSCLDRKLLLAR